MGSLNLLSGNSDLFLENNTICCQCGTINDLKQTLSIEIAQLQ